MGDVIPFPGLKSLSVQTEKARVILTLSEAVSAGDTEREDEMGTSPLIGVLAHAWIVGRQARGELQGDSPRVEMTRLQSLVKVHGRRPVHQLDKDTLLMWQASIGAYAPNTRKSYAATVRLFVRWLHEEGHIDRDPSKAIAKVNMPRRVPRALSRDDVRKVLGIEAIPRLKAIIWLMLGCALRCVEVSNLDMDDYDRDAGTILVRGKFGHERVLPLPPEAQSALDCYIGMVRGHRPGPLFLAIGSKMSVDRRMSPHWISTRVSRAMKLAGVHQPYDRKSAHAIRHTAAADLYKMTKDLQLAQQMLGHRSIATTESYLRGVDLDDLRVAMASRRYGETSLGEPLRGAPSPGVTSPEAGGPTGTPEVEPATNLPVADGLLEREAGMTKMLMCVGIAATLMLAMFAGVGHHRRRAVLSAQTARVTTPAPNTSLPRVVHTASSPAKSVPSRTAPVRTAPYSPQISQAHTAAPAQSPEVTVEYPDGTCGHTSLADAQADHFKVIPASECSYGTFVPTVLPPPTPETTIPPAQCVNTPACSAGNKH